MKKLLVVFAVVFAAVSAHASLLYWQVLDANEGAGTASAWADGWTSANLYVVQGAEKSGNLIQSAKYFEGSEGGTLEKSIDVSAYKDGTYSFYVELVNSSSSGTTVAARSSDWKSYSQLADANMIVGTDLETTHATWGGGSFVSAPEPTSAMLMLLGVAGLALRRKQRKLA